MSRGLRPEQPLWGACPPEVVATVIGVSSDGGARVPARSGWVGR